MEQEIRATTEQAAKHQRSLLIDNAAATGAAVAFAAADLPCRTPSLSQGHPR